MKDFIKGYAIFTLAVIASISFSVLIGKVNTNVEEQKKNVEVLSDYEEKDEDIKVLSEITVYDTVKQITFTADVKKLISSMVSYQLPSDAPEESVKVQAILMYTYLLSQKENESLDPTPELYGAIISTDNSKYPRFDLGTSVPEYIEKAVSSVFARYIEFNGEPIAPAFCLSSGGQTVSAYVAFGENISYLQPVFCEEDKDYITDVSLTSSEVFARITTRCEGVTLYGDPSSWIEIVNVYPDGYVVSLTVGDKVILSGKELARILNLPSANFKLNYSEEFDVFTFNVKGCGHLVGLSINGSIEMARKNKTCEEIINHFFTGVKIIDQNQRS